jgi:hypothetical protein
VGERDGLLREEAPGSRRPDRRFIGLPAVRPFTGKSRE